MDFLLGHRHWLRDLDQRIPLVISYSGALIGEQRLWLAIVMQGLSERARNMVPEWRPEPVSIIGRANQWATTRDFELCCELADLDPNIARLIPPDRARAALHLLLRGNTQSKIHAALQGEFHHAQESRRNYRRSA